MSKIKGAGKRFETIQLYVFLGLETSMRLIIGFGFSFFFAIQFSLTCYVYFYIRSF